MAASKSWFSGLSPAKGRRSPRLSNELPRWRTPSPMAASMIPPPILQSTAALSRETSTEPVVVEEASPFDDRQHELEADLQHLLDAQAEGLIRGLEGNGADSKSSTGSTTPTIRSMRSTPARRFRKPAARRIGLRSARKGIYTSIVALSDLKDEELEELETQVRRSEQSLEQIEVWETKKRGIQEASETVDSSEDTARVQRLKQEANTVQEEINGVELQLMELKSRHRKLLREAAAVENAVQAKLATYTSSLRILEEDVQKFLNLEPDHSTIRASPADGKASMWKLPAKRRSLEMAREFWDGRRAALLEQRTAMSAERAMLAEGADMWKDAVMDVTEFEKELRAEMASLSSSPFNSTFGWDEPAQAERNIRPKNLLSKISRIIDSLESKHHHAEEKNWTLLIAAIGAELDALRRGRQLLEGVVGNSQDNEAESSGSNAAAALSDAGQDIHELDRSFETARRPSLSRHLSSASDDPDPELLFSRQDGDFE